MRIEPGRYDVWPEFSLQVNTPLEFLAGGRYHLQGPNGSGKSSFLTRVLLPRLRSRTDIYALFFEQQMRYQLPAIKAYASLLPPHRLIEKEADAVRYLLDDLLACVKQESRPVYVLMDESPQALVIRDFLSDKLPSACLVLSAHTELVPARPILFTPLSSILSEVSLP